MYALNVTTWTHIFCGNYVLANALADELAVLAEERGALYWKPIAKMNQGRILGLIGEFTKALPMLTSGIAAFRSTEAQRGTARTTTSSSSTTSTASCR